MLELCDLGVTAVRPFALRENLSIPSGRDYTDFERLMAFDLCDLCAIVADFAVGNE